MLHINKYIYIGLKIKLYKFILMQSDNLNFLIENTIYILPQSDNINNISNRIYIDYPIFKKFVNPSNFENIITYFILLVNKILLSYNNFQLHINLHYFSVSAIDKYKGLLYLFYEKYKTKYIEYIDSAYIYYTPSYFATIKLIFNKLSLFSKINPIEPINYSIKESDRMIEILLKEYREQIKMKINIEYQEEIEDLEEIEVEDQEEII